MKIFKIYVDDESHLPCQIDFDGEISYPEELDAKGRESQKGLWILALYTVIQRETGAKAFNSLIEIPSVYNDLISALFTPLSRANLSPSHWLVEVFNDNPRSNYLIARTREGRKVVNFTDTVSVSIVRESSAIPCDFKELEKFIELWAQDNFHPLEIFPQVTMLSSMGHLAITKGTTSGHLTSPSQIRLTLESNCPTHFCIFWIDSEGNLFCLYPHPDSILGIPPSKLVNTGGGRIVNIPEKTYLTIQTQPGIETCVILTASALFSDESIDQIRHRLVASSFSERPFLHTTTFRSRVLNATTAPPSQSKGRLGSPLSMNLWEQEITASLSALAERIHFFHIPNKP